MSPGEALADRHRVASRNIMIGINPDQSEWVAFRMRSSAQNAPAFIFVENVFDIFDVCEQALSPGAFLTVTNESQHCVERVLRLVLLLRSFDARARSAPVAALPQA